LLIFDGDCHFCMGWIARWKQSTGANVDYAPFQEASVRFPEIPQAAYESSVHWLEPNGVHLSGADAVFRLFDFAQEKRPILELVTYLPGFMPLARIAYRFVATRRSFFSGLTRALTAH